MSDGDLLLKAILDQPDDDNARQVYADWLQESGDEERAELIRVQIELAKWPGVPSERPFVRKGDPPAVQAYCEAAMEAGVPRLRRRQAELLEAVGYHVVNTPRVWPVSMTLGAAETGDGAGRLSIRRGFVEWWRMRAADWIAHGDEVLTAHPVRTVKLTTAPELATFLARRGQKRGFIGPIDRAWWLRALTDEWRGVEFELPP